MLAPTSPMFLCRASSAPVRPGRQQGSRRMWHCAWAPGHTPQCREYQPVCTELGTWGRAASGNEHCPPAQLAASLIAVDLGCDAVAALCHIIPSHPVVPVLQPGKSQNRSVTRGWSHVAACLTSGCAAAGWAAGPSAAPARLAPASRPRAPAAASWAPAPPKAGAAAASPGRGSRRCGRGGGGASGAGCC